MTMKRTSLLSILFCLLTPIVTAQTMLWDGESYAIGSQGGCWNDGSPTVVANPETSGINTSAKCLKFTMSNGNKTVKIPFRDWIAPSMNGSKRISLMIRKNVNENVKIEISDPTNGSSGYWHKAASWYGGNGSWQRVVFDFSAHDDFDYPGIIGITAQTSNINGNQDVYIDNVKIEGVPSVNGTPLASCPYGSLQGAITITGSWDAGSCNKLITDENWQQVSYNDFDKLAARMSARVTSVDMRSATTSGAYNAFASVNPNILIYANEQFAHNVLNDGIFTTNYVETPEYNGMPTYFTPPSGFVGDPMPYYDTRNNEFMIAYLQDYRPNPETFHPIHMLTSGNLTDFTYHGCAIPCGEVNSQEQSLGTGCIFYDETKGQYYAFYTGHQGNFSSLPGIERQEELYKATSTDGRNWVKQGYVLKAPNGYDWNQFRDPHIFKDGNTYHMILTAMRTINGINYPAIAHFTATDIDAVNTSDDVNAAYGGWVLRDPLYIDMSRGNVYQLYECPDMFHIGDRYYMVYSDQRDNRVHYMYRRYLENTEGDPWVYGGIIDGNGFSFYAGKTASDGNDRYIFGWCTTTEGTGGKDWAGSLVVHKLYRAEDGSLALTVPHTFDNKFNTNISTAPLSQSQGISMSGNKYTLTQGSKLEYGRLKRADKIFLKFKAESNSNEVFGFSLRDNSNNDIRFSFRMNLADQKLYLNKDNKNGNVEEISQVSLPRSADGVYNLRIYHEQSIIVVYVNDKIAFTNRIYNISRNPWSVFCENGSVKVDKPSTYSY